MMFVISVMCFVLAFALHVHAALAGYAGAKFTSWSSALAGRQWLTLALLFYIAARMP